jgi:hypothetical protein
MPIPVTFPDWVPWWVQLLVVVVAILLGLAFALMPFSVFGVKSRLDAVEARLDEIQHDIRSLALRLPEPVRRNGYEDELIIRATSPAAEAAVARPPIPPASWAPERADRRLAGGSAPPETGRSRAEPRLGPR